MKNTGRNVSESRIGECPFFPLRNALCLPLNRLRKRGLGRRQPVCFSHIQDDSPFGDVVVEAK